MATWKRGWSGRRLGVLAAVLTAACGSEPAADPSPAPTPSPSGASNPCASVGLQSSGGPSDPLKQYGADRRDVREALWVHRTRGGEARALGAVAPASAEDVGDIALLRDDGSVVLSPNPFDLRGRGLRFQPNAAGGFDVLGADAGFRPTLGQRLSLADDDSARVDLPFRFPFFGQDRSSAYVNSDGNLTFGQGDTAITERGLVRLLEGAPRVGLFFADLDPSAGGGLYVNAGSDGLTVTWCSVPGFGSSQRVTAQATLLPDGSVDMKFADTTSLGTGIVALSPGETGSFATLNLSAAGSLSGGGAAVGERFLAAAELDLVRLARLFFESHGDDYDQLVVFADRRIIPEANTVAFETSIQNDVRGLGLTVFDESGEFGSQGELESLVIMDDLAKYPADPQGRIPDAGENTTLALLAHESGHRWLAFLRFRDASSSSSDALLGRQLAHWSFFMDSDASVMEGNDIEDLGGGSFRTAGAVSRYSLLDLYAMGLVGEAEVLPFFYVANPAGTTLNRASAPRTGVTFTGTRRDVTIQDVVAALGPREPSVTTAPRTHRQAFVYLLATGRQSDPSAEIAKLDRIRLAWEPFFAQATGSRMSVEARLR